MEQASSYKDRDGVACQGVQLQNFLKTKRGKYVKLNNEANKSGSGTFDFDGLDAQMKAVFNCLT